MFISIFNNRSTWRFVLAAWLTFAVGVMSHVHAQETAQTADQQSIEDALNAIRDGDHQTGRAMLRSMSEQGNPDAMYHLAEISRLGIGGEASMSIATMFYRLASRLGHEPAAMKLANILYFEGQQSVAETAEAFAIWQTYALTDNPEAAYLLGIIYWNGENGRTPDPVRGYGLVWKAAEAGYKDAVAAELEMRTLLPGDARQAAQTYAGRLSELGFSDELLNMDLLVEGWSPDEEETLVEKPKTGPPFGISRLVLPYERKMRAQCFRKFSKITRVWLKVCLTRWCLHQIASVATNWCLAPWRACILP